MTHEPHARVSDLDVVTLEVKPAASFYEDHVDLYVDGRLYARIDAAVSPRFMWPFVW